MIAAQLPQSQKCSMGFSLLRVEATIFPPASAFFLLASVKSMRNSRPCPRYRNVAEHCELRHFDTIEDLDKVTVAVPYAGTALWHTIENWMRTITTWMARYDNNIFRQMAAQRKDSEFPGAVKTMEWEEFHCSVSGEARSTLPARQSVWLSDPEEPDQQRTVTSLGGGFASAVEGVSGSGRGSQGLSSARERTGCGPHGARTPQAPEKEAGAWAGLWRLARNRRFSPAAHDFRNRFDCEPFS